MGVRIYCKGQCCCCFTMSWLYQWKIYFTTVVTIPRCSIIYIQVGIRYIHHLSPAWLSRLNGCNNKNVYHRLRCDCPRYVLFRIRTMENLVYAGKKSTLSFGIDRWGGVVVRVMKVRIGRSCTQTKAGQRRPVLWLLLFRA